MGYANVFPYTELDVGSVTGTDMSITLSTIAATTTFSQYFEIPSWVANRIEKAFLTMRIPAQENTNAGINYTVGDQYIQVSTDNGATYNNALRIPGGMFYVPGSTIAYQSIVLYGNLDFAQYGLTPGVHIHLKWIDRLSHADNLNVWNIHFSLRLILK